MVLVYIFNIFDKKSSNTNLSIILTSIGPWDLTKGLPVDTKDEVGEMAVWFNTFIEKLQNIIQQIADNSSGVMKSSKRLSERSQNLLSNSSDTSQRATSVATSSEEMSSTIREIVVPRIFQGTARMLKTMLQSFLKVILS